MAANQNYEPAVFFLGVTHYFQGNYEQARTYLTQYAGRRPNNIRVRQLLAVLDLRDGEYDDAEKWLAPVLRTVPDDLLTLKLMANIAMRQGQTARAIEYMNRVKKD